MITSFSDSGFNDESEPGRLQQDVSSVSTLRAKPASHFPTGPRTHEKAPDAGDGHHQEEKKELLLGGGMGNWA